MRLVLIGPPGAGKGTQAEFISARYHIPAISTGVLFREHVATGTNLGQAAHRYMEAGELVPDEVTIEMVSERLDEKDAANGFLLDGFPRTVPQAEVLDEQLTLRGVKLDVVVQLEVATDEVIRRISGRRICHGCGRVWHVDFNPTKVDGVCDKCGGELFQREDDQPATVRNRLEVFFEQTAPLIDFYGAQGKLVTVDAMGPVDEITTRLLTALAERA